MRITKILLASCIFWTACQKENITKSNDDSIAQTFKKAEIKYLQNFKNIIVGEWKIDSMHMKLGLISLPNSKDTMVYNYGKIVLTALEPDQINSEKFNHLKGYIVATNNDTVPIKSQLLGMPDKEKIDSISYVFGAVESGFYFEKPIPTNELSASYQFLDNYMLNDNFQMSLDKGNTKFIWKGSRFIVQINLTKIK